MRGKFKNFCAQMEEIKYEDNWIHEQDNDDLEVTFIIFKDNRGVRVFKGKNSEQRAYQEYKFLSNKHPDSKYSFRKIEKYTVSVENIHTIDEYDTEED